MYFRNYPFSSYLSNMTVTVEALRSRPLHPPKIPTRFSIYTRRFLPISLVQCIHEWETVGSLKSYISEYSEQKKRTMSSSQCLEDQRVVDETRTSRPRMKRTSSVVCLRNFQGFSDTTKYGKWCSRLQIAPKSNVIRGCKLPLKGIVSGNLMMKKTP